MGEPAPVSESNVAFFTATSGALAYNIGGGGGSSGQLMWYDRSGKETGKLGDQMRQFSVNLATDGYRAVIERAHSVEAGPVQPSPKLPHSLIEDHPRT